MIRINMLIKNSCGKKIINDLVEHLKSLIRLLFPVGTECEVDWGYVDESKKYGIRFETDNRCGIQKLFLVKNGLLKEYGFDIVSLNEDTDNAIDEVIDLEALGRLLDKDKEE